MEPHLASWSKPGESLARSTHPSRGLSKPAASVITAGGWCKLIQCVGLSKRIDII